MQPDLGLALFGFIVLILSIIIHEVAHGYAAYRLGDPTAKLAGRLTLNPLWHIDPIGSVILPAFLVLTQSPILFGWAKPVPYNPYNLKNQRWGEALVAGAGIATNLILAVIFALVARAAHANGMDLFAGLAATITLTNLYLGIFNLIPIPPLDGYTFFRGLLPYKLAVPFRAFEERLRGAGIFALFFVVAIFYYVLAEPFHVLVLWLFGMLVG
jgi:Zn-dependent protease